MPTEPVQQDQNSNNNQQTNQQQGEPATWEDALKGLPENVQGLYNQHVTGLQNTVKATRDERDAFRKQLTELQKQAEKGSELEKTINGMTAQLEAANAKADFFMEGAKPEIGCRNLTAAYALASTLNLFGRNGAPDWAQIKATAPELFGAPAVQGNAGSGTQAPPKTDSMNERILRAAGKR